MTYHTIDPAKKVRVKGKVVSKRKEYPKLRTFTCGQDVDEISTHDYLLDRKLKKTLSKKTEIIHITDIKFLKQHGKTNWDEQKRLT